MININMNMKKKNAKKLRNIDGQCFSVDFNLASFLFVTHTIPP